MKKKNNSGFTLVELIVVVALLAIMMGAILRLIDPIRNVYRDTYDTVNTKTVGETMISYVEDKIRYSTNVLVLENYVGVPEITPILGKKSAKVGASKYEYTNCIIVDNTNIRGSMFSDYKGDTGTSYARKGCKGCIYEIKDIGEAATLDLTKASAGTLGEDIYGDYDHDIKINTVEEDSLAYLSVDVLSTPKKYEGSSYVNDTDNTFKAERSFDLVNINISEKKVNRTHDRYALDKCVDFDAAPDYTSYPQAAVPSGINEKQQKYFDTTDPNNKYTYIFFVINKSDSSKCTVNFMYDPNDTNKSLAGHFISGAEYQVTAGQTLSSAAVNKMNNLGSRSGYMGYHFTDGTEKVDLATYVINDDITFMVVYEKNPDAVIHTAKYLLPDGSPLTDTTGAEITGEINNGFAVTNLPDPTGAYNPDTQYYEWYVKGTTTKAEDYPVTTTPAVEGNKAPEIEVEYQCVIKDKIKVSFIYNGTDFVPPQYIKSRAELTYPTDIPTTSEAGKVFKDWYDGTGKRFADSPCVADTVFKPVFDTVPVPPTPPAGTYNITVSHSDDTGAEYSAYHDGKNWEHPYAGSRVTLSNTSSTTDFSGTVTVKVKFNTDVSTFTMKNTQNVGSSYVISGDTVTVKYTGTLAKYGGNVQLYFQMVSPDEVEQGKGSGVVKVTSVSAST